MLIPLIVFVLLAAPAAAQPSLLDRMMVIEDARSASADDIAVFTGALASNDADVRRVAVRGLGRLERPTLATTIARALADVDPRVRAEAANALAQVTRRSEDVGAAMTALLARASDEGDAAVRRVVFGSIGRLPYGNEAEARRAEQALAAGLPLSAKGLESFVRLSRKVAPPRPETLAALRDVAVPGPASRGGTARDRRLAMAALVSAGIADASAIAAALDDADNEVRRLAAAALAGDQEMPTRASTLRRALADPHPQVRYEALRAWGRTQQTSSCEPIRAAVKDADAHVALLALDLLGAGCPAGEESPATLLRGEAAAVPATGAVWHRASHALVSLARVQPDAARTTLAAHASHATWQVRMYAARAASVLRDQSILDRLMSDANDNVREAALSGLLELKAASAVPSAIDSLSRRDYQLVMTAARTLQALPLGESREKALTALRSAFTRIAAERRDTSRDPREAIAKTLATLGDTTPLPAVAPSTPPVLTGAAVAALRGATLRFHMAGKGTFDLRLLVDEAPASALRVATRAREGYYNGLTFHRVVPNFVIQGGSPGANEYMGDGPYMRDEVGLLPHARGAVGISTRGRDTGDAQIFVNLVDIPRLDHTYTVFAEVSSGLDVVDRILEGDVIERVDVIAPRSR